MNYQMCRYDPEKDEVIVVREGVAETVDPEDLPEWLRERFEKFLAEHGDKRKSA
jgi:hypothetical protein